jgi:hypothetical protein
VVVEVLGGLAYDCALSGSDIGSCRVMALNAVGIVTTMRRAFSVAAWSLLAFWYNIGEEKTPKPTLCMS